MDKLIPIEVKASENKRAKSLSVYIDKYKPDISVKINAMNLSKNENVLNMPQWLLWKLKSFV